MVGRIRHSDKAPAGFEDACELRQSTVKIGNVVEHPRRDSHVEVAVGKGKLLNVPHTRIDSFRPLDLDHALRLVDSDHLDAEFVVDPLGELSLPSPDLEHPLRLCLCNGCEGELTRIVALGIDVGRLPGPEVVLALVLRPDERSLVDGLRQPRATFGSLSSSAAISSRIFSSERRMSRDTCICEMPTCWAICDCVNPSKKRRWRMVRSRSSRTRNPGASTARSSETSYWCSISPSVSSGSSSSPSSWPPPVESDREE